MRIFSYYGRETRRISWQQTRNDDHFRKGFTAPGACTAGPTVHADSPEDYRERLRLAEEHLQRISRELHDETGQHLTTLSLSLKALEPSISAYVGSDPEVKAMLLRLRNIAKELVSDLHRVAVELRPSALDDLGLVAALYGYIERWSEGTGIPASFDTFGLSDFSEGATVYRNWWRRLSTGLFRKR